LGLISLSFVVHSILIVAQEVFVVLAELSYRLLAVDNKGAAD